MWASTGLRPVAGTTIDFRVLLPALSEREMLLLLLPIGNSETQRESRTLLFRNDLLTLMLTKNLMDSALLLS